MLPTLQRSTVLKQSRQYENTLVVNTHIHQVVTGFAIMHHVLIFIYIFTRIPEYSEFKGDVDTNTQED